MSTRGALSVWFVWGLGCALQGLGTVAVIALQPVPAQHAVVGSAIVITCMTGGLALWAAGATLARSSIAATIGLVVILTASVLQGLLGRAFLYQDAGHPVAPILLLGASITAFVAIWVPPPRWTAIPGTALLLAAYVGSSLRWNDDWGGLLLGGAAIAFLPLLVMTCIGLANALIHSSAESRRAQVR
jgi:hypothetical protein